MRPDCGARDGRINLASGYAVGMKPITASAILALVLLLPACERAPVAAPPVQVEPASAPRAYLGQAWSMPATAIAAQPDLVATADGKLLLSWIEPQDDGHALKFASYDLAAPIHGSGSAAATGAGWSPPQTIASGGDWFVNWADTPHLARTDDGALWAHWLQKSAAATYAYDVALVRSGDGGRSWSKPVLVNNDGKAAEHGFVSLWPAARDAIGVSWLDGRNSGGGHAGAMTLRAARFDANLGRSGETELDAMTCDCCQTDVALTARGPLLVYRDRTPAEIRDIAVTRGQGAAWAPPHLVHADGWKMPACPVNGPSVAARGNEAVVAWYTAPGDVPMLRVARSSDAGDHFAPPLTIDQGPALQGRVDVALDPESAWVLWLREEAGGQTLHLARYRPDLSRELQRIEVAKVEGRGRATGFPQLALGGDAVYVVWTAVVDGKPRLRGARIARE